MKFLKFALTLLITTSLLSQPIKEFRAVKITNVDSDILFDDQKIADGMDYLASIGINVILTVVWNSSGANGDYTLYPSQVMNEYFGKPLHPAIPFGRDPLKRIIIEAHRNGMEVYPWFEMGFSTSYSQNGGHILQRYPSWALLDNQGNLVVKYSFDWMSAIHPKVQEFMLSLVTEVVDNYDVDGIEFSDRIPAMPVEGGYEPATKALYAAEHDGAEPPVNSNDPSWMRWRADKLSAFNKAARDSVKARSGHIIFSSSPSLYPWSYQEYLQDSKTWVEQDIVDNIIPQVYRQNFNDYRYELDKALSYIPHHKKDTIFSGMLIYLKGPGYLIAPDFFLNSLKLNRDRGVRGEAFFFYEGLRQNNDQLGDTLKATYYSQPALNPHRHGNIWRPKALIVNEDDPDAVITGLWDTRAGDGFKPDFLSNNNSEPASISYFFDVPYNAWFDVFAFIVNKPVGTTQAPYTLYSDTDSTLVHLDQQGYYSGGWQPVGTVYLSAGRHKALTLRNENVAAGDYIFADATMLMINRKKSPDVIVTKVARKKEITTSEPQFFELGQNYPNPFNAKTTIRFKLDHPGLVNITVYDILGREVSALINEMKTAGIHTLKFDATGLSSGIYIYKMKAGQMVKSRRMVYIR